MDAGQASGSLRYAASIAVMVVALALVGCGTLTLLPHQSDNSSSQIKSLKDLADAYLKVQPGTTRASQLADLGFDTATPNVETLSYLAVIERFMTGSTTKFDHLDEALQGCIEARDRCNAFVFKSGDGEGNGGGVLASLGLGSAQAAGHGPEVTLVVENGRVAYKMISGVPATMLAQQHSAPAPAAPRPPAMAAAYRY